MAGGFMLTPQSGQNLRNRPKGALNTRLFLVNSKQRYLDLRHAVCGAWLGAYPDYHTWEFRSERIWIVPSGLWRKDGQTAADS